MNGKGKSSLIRPSHVLFASFLVLVAAGCGGAPQLSSAPAVEAEPPIVRFLNWAEYISPAVLERFQDETGIRVEYLTFDNQEELLGRVRSDPARYDVIVADDTVISALAELGLLQEIDLARVPNLRHIDPRYLSRPADPDARYSAPYHWGTTLLGYRRDRIKVPPDSWSVLWDKKYRGRIMMLSDVQEVVGVTALCLGLPIDTTDSDQLEAIRRHIVAQVPLVSKYADTITIRDAMVSGECWLATIYSGDAAVAAKREPMVGYVVPKEGAPIWIDCLCIPRDAKHRDAANAFINYLLDPDVAAENASYLNYATPNMEAMEKLSPEFKADRAIFPSRDVLAKCAFLPKLDQPRQRLYNQTWADIWDRMESSRDRGDVGGR